MSRFSFRDVLKENPVVVTGMGVYCAAGTTPEELWQAVVSGISPARWLEFPEAPSIQRIPACIAPPIHSDRPEFRTVRKMDRCVQMAFVAAMQAADEALLTSRPVTSERLSILAGTSRGPINKWNEGMHWLERERMLPSLAANSTLACLSGALSQVFHAKGTCLTLASACASAASAIALGAQFIATGEADIVIAGGADAPLNPLVVSQLQAAGVLGEHEDPRRACRPFDVSRNGLLLGEGAAFLVLESASHAKARGAKPLAQLCGWGTGADTSGRAGVSENGDGLLQVMQHALAVAGLEAGQIDYVNAHGTGTLVNDRSEARGMSRLFGECDVPCSSTKPITGHCMGATPAIEAIISILALQNQQAPPNANCTQLDPECALDIIKDGPRPLHLRAAMSNSLGFWGNNASLILRALSL